MLQNNEIKDPEGFSSLGLSAPLLKSLRKKGYESPTDIQKTTIPPILNGRDVLGSSQTGTGKTGAFTLPLLDRLSAGPSAASNQVRSLILVPSRELADQVYDNVRVYGRYLKLRITVAYGGVKINPQMQNLCRGADILVATPGRLLDLYSKNAVKFSKLEVLVLDEADRMLDMGFMDEIQQILDLLPEVHQTLLFSATFPSDVKQLVQSVLHDPVEVSVTPGAVTADTVKQVIHPVDRPMKGALLSHLVQNSDWDRVLVFCKTRNGADRLVKKLEKRDIKASVIHGGRSQAQRSRALSDFKKGRSRILIATDLAARGLDIYQLPVVINYDLPHVKDFYTHRIGRTGRAGMRGLAVSLVCAEEIQELKDIQRLIKAVIDREVIPGFDPAVPLPETELDTRPFKIKKPKKNKRKNSENMG